MKYSFGRVLAVILTSVVGLHSLTSVCRAVPWKLDYKDGEQINLQQVTLKSETGRLVLGAFWSMQRTHFPPLPCYPKFLTEAGYDIPVYALDSERSIFLVDDRAVDYDAIYKAREKKKQEETLLRSLELNTGLMSMEEFSLLEGEGGMAMMSYSSDDLWLEIITYTNTTASLVIHRPVGDDNPSHDIFYSTDLASPTN